MSIKQLLTAKKPFFILLPIAFILLAIILLATQQTRIAALVTNGNNQSKKLAEQQKELEKIKSEDQFARNDKLQKEIKDLEGTFTKALVLYERILDLKAQNKKTADLDDLYAKTLSFLAKRNYSSGTATLTLLANELDKQTQTAATSSVPTNVAVNNSPPSSGYNRQQVQTEIGSFVIDIVSADIGSTRVIVDTASDGNCADNCPVLSLGDYAARNGAFAGINGSYFCPASYPSCAGKTNSFDTLAMNKNKTYINSDNNVYSTVPAVIFGGGWVRFVGQSLEWGRDTSVDGVLANQPLLLSGGNITFGGDGDPKKGEKGTRSFVGSKGSTVYIGVVHNATVAEVAYGLKALGLENALNLDSGGSTALWFNGYKAGPGRNIPNVILFVRK